MTSVPSKATSCGFGDPAFERQALFRALMGVFAEPGAVADFSDRVEAPDGLDTGTAVILAALSDADGPVFLNACEGDAPAWLAAQTGAAPVADRREASFVVLPRWAGLAGPDRMPPGAQPDPDRSATLILPVEALEGGAPLILSGPGIETTRRIAPRGVPRDFVEYRARNAALFPRGHDLVLVTGPRVMVLPRTTRVVAA